jgi:hypothetical protein
LASPLPHPQLALNRQRRPHPLRHLQAVMDRTGQARMSTHTRARV